ncbi:MAG: prephenate dehydrogenase, partial [Cellvibrionales bacterium]|nr:prephenate dehydrogenase [Cellvibrionales bacterium]
MQNLVLIGTGLIGGSLAAAARTHQAARRIWAINRKQHTSDQARQQGIADESHTHADLPTLTPKLNPGDTVVIAVPVGSYPPILQQLGNLPPGVWLTDVGSTKSSVIEAVRQHW